MGQFKYLEIVFENVESIVIPVEQVSSFSFGDITRIEKDPFQRENVYQAKHINLKIKYKNESELKYNSDDYDDALGMYVGNPLSNNVKDRPNILGRLLNHKDIVVIQVSDKNENEFMEIYVPWHDEDQYNNRFETIKAENGILEIEIKE